MERLQTTELRINNLVLFQGKPEYISSIHSDNTIRLKKELDSKHCHGCYLISAIEPITLTEEWLIKFGWIFNKEIDVFEHKKSVSFCIKKGIVSGWVMFNFVLKSTMSFRNFYYVHQLQNLYFALTGEELVLKE